MLTLFGCMFSLFVLRISAVFSGLFPHVLGLLKDIQNDIYDGVCLYMFLCCSMYAHRVVCLRTYMYVCMYVYVHVHFAFGLVAL